MNNIHVYHIWQSHYCTNLQFPSFWNTVFSRLTLFLHWFNVHIGLRSASSLHEVSDQILGDVLHARLFPLVYADLLILPLFAGAETAGAMVDLAVFRSKQRLVDTRVGGDGVVATTSGTSRHRTRPVRTVLAVEWDRRSAPLHNVNLYASHSVVTKA